MSFAYRHLVPAKIFAFNDLAIMKTASLGLLEVRVVRVNAGGDAPPDPPSVGDDTGPFPLSFDVTGPLPLSLFS